MTLNYLLRYLANIFIRKWLLRLEAYNGNLDLLDIKIRMIYAYILLKD